MTDPTCTEFNPACFRCDLSRDEVTHTPARVTLTDDERESLICDCAWAEGDQAWRSNYCPFHSSKGQYDVAVPATEMVARVEQIIAARESALRAQIKAEIREMPIDCYYGTYYAPLSVRDAAARIAGGDA